MAPSQKSNKLSSKSKNDDNLKRFINRIQNEEIEDDNEENNPNKRSQVRLRRTKSVSVAEAVATEDDRKRRRQPDKPIHKPRDSLLSWSSGFDRYEGIVNWGFLVLVIGGLRLFLENVIKYGILVNPIDWLVWVLQESRRDNYYHTPLWFLAFNLNFVIAYILEKCLANKLIASWYGFYLHAVHLIAVTTVPMVVFFYWPNAFSLLGRMMITTLHTLSFIKIWSYVQVNHWCRDDRDFSRKGMRGRSKSFRNIHDEKHMSVSDAEESYTASNENISAPPETLVQYPDNLSMGDLYYFLLAPTLCYELNFPRTNRIRKWFLFRRAAEVLVLSNLLIGLFQQWMIPSVRNSFRAFSDMDGFRATERLLKLSIPNHLMWLIWFYVLFHSLLNTVGELMRFSDRNFYNDWWNAGNIGKFWQDWNLPVHRWAVRHVYKPIANSGYPVIVAQVCVFILSAFFHEYMVCVPLQMFKAFVFMGMVAQIPLIYITTKVSKLYSSRAGNVMMWAALILGQPLGLLIYFHDYAVKNIDPADLLKY